MGEQYKGQRRQHRMAEFTDRVMAVFFDDEPIRQKRTAATNPPNTGQPQFPHLSDAAIDERLKGVNEIRDLGEDPSQQRLEH